MVSYSNRPAYRVLPPLLLLPQSFALANSGWLFSPFQGSQEFLTKVTEPCSLGLPQTHTYLIAGGTFLLSSIVLFLPSFFLGPSISPNYPLYSQKIDLRKTRHKKKKETREGKGEGEEEEEGGGGGEQCHDIVTSLNV